MEMPLTVSLMAALTSAMACMPRRVTCRARLRNPSVSPTMKGMKASSSSARCHSVRTRITARISACSTSAANSVEMTTSWPKSLLSEVMRETMRPEENWS